MDLSQTNKDYRLIGDVPFAVIEPMLRAKNSPMLVTARATHEAAKPMTALFWAQGWLENQWETTGKIIRPEDHNPLSLRPWTEDPTATKTGDVLAWDTRAKVGTMKVPPYATGAIRARDGSYMLRFPDDASGAREWKRRLTDPAYKNGIYTRAKTLEQMLAIYAPPGDVHPETGVDNADTGYAGVVRTMLQRFLDAADDLPQPERPEDPTMPEKPYILIVAGHRSTGDPGNPTEKNLTDDLAAAYVSTFRKAGFTCDWFQRDLDRDSNPDQTLGDLSTVATGCRNVLLAREEAMAVMLDLHFNGSESAVHVIVPDNVGLKSGYGDGAPGNDTAANNVLDCTVASTIAQKIVGANRGMRLYSGRLGIPGVMSERETGVALDGNWRLGMFGGTAIVRDRAVRLVVEHGGTNDFTRYNDFPNACARAALAAIQEVFQVDVTAPQPEPPLPASPFRVGDTIRVKTGLNIRRAWTTAETFEGQPNVIATLPVGTIATIKAGPNVKDGYRWWDLDVPGDPVRGSGHVAEGDGTVLFIEAYTPPVEEPEEPQEPVPDAGTIAFVLYRNGAGFYFPPDSAPVVVSGKDAVTDDLIDVVGEIVGAS